MFHAQKVGILITFFMGVVSGAYLYLTGFATTFKLPEVTTDNIYKEFVITVESYGKCTDSKTCLSFQVLENGSFRAIFDSPILSKREVKEGRIPLAIRRSIKENLTPTNLQLNTVPLGTPECRYEGDNYRFRVS
jgi:hypothetical protein